LCYLQCLIKFFVPKYAVFLHCLQTWNLLGTLIIFFLGKVAKHLATTVCGGDQIRNRLGFYCCCDMRNDDVVSWAAAQVKELLPGLEGDPLTAAVRYSLSLSPDDTDRHWRSLLGSTPQVDSFLKQLRERRQNASPKQQVQQEPRIPFSATPPPRIHTPPVAPARTPSPSKVLRITSSTRTSRNRKGPGKMTSDLLGNGKANKPAPPSPLAVAIQENRPMTELEEIDSAIQSLTLESQSNSSTKKKRVECGCFGTKHEVYPLAPNCLYCGRIHCVSEGFGPCFFCGEDLVSEAVREDVVRELRHERGIAKTKAANEKVRKARATGDTRHHRVWATKVGGQGFVDVRSAPMTPSLSRDSDSGGGSGYATPSSALLEAERRRDELLEFDRTFAERTKIIGIFPRPSRLSTPPSVSPSVYACFY